VHSVKPQSQNNTFNGYDLNIYNLQKKEEYNFNRDKKKMACSEKYPKRLKNPWMHKT
jgi:hypothetical protein